MSSDSDLHMPILTEITELKRRVGELEKRFEHIDTKLDEIKNILSTQQVDNVRELTRMSAHLCPNPGACDTSALKLQMLDNRLTKMEEWKNQAIGAIQGGKTTLGAVWAVIGGVVVSIIHWVISTFSTN